MAAFPQSFPNPRAGSFIHENIEIKPAICPRLNEKPTSQEVQGSEMKGFDYSNNSLTLV